MITVLANARMFDGVSEEFADGVSVVVENDRIREIAGREPIFQVRVASIAQAGSSCPD